VKRSTGSPKKEREEFPLPLLWALRGSNPPKGGGSRCETLDRLPKKRKGRVSSSLMVGAAGIESAKGRRISLRIARPASPKKEREEFPLPL